MLFRVALSIELQESWRLVPGLRSEIIKLLHVLFEVRECIQRRTSILCFDGASDHFLE